MVAEQVMGVTDVDDKIINRAAEQGRTGLARSKKRHCLHRFRGD